MDPIVTFQNDHQNSADIDTNNEGFRSPLGIALKIITMMTGDLNSGSFPFKLLPGASHIVFVTFFIFMTIVLPSFVIGLAVFDGDAVQREVILLYSSPLS